GWAARWTSSTAAPTRTPSGSCRPSQTCCPPRPGRCTSPRPRSWPEPCPPTTGATKPPSRIAVPVPTEASVEVAGADVAVRQVLLHVGGRHLHAVEDVAAVGVGQALGL